MTRRHRGLSLIELLIAIALLLALFGAMFGFLFNTLQKRAWLTERMERQRAVGALIEHLERDLTTAVAAYGSESGIDGTNTSLVVLSRGVDASTAPTAGADALLADLMRTTYTFEDGAGLTFERSAIDARRAEVSTTLGASIARVRFRYHDGSTWRDRFDCMSAGGLPRAVEIAVWYLGDEDDDEADDIAAFESQLYEKRTRERDAPEPTFDDGAMTDPEAEPLPDRIRVIAIPDSAPSVPIRAVAGDDDLFGAEFAR